MTSHQHVRIRRARARIDGSALPSPRFTAARRTLRAVARAFFWALWRWS